MSASLSVYDTTAKHREALQGVSIMLRSIKSHMRTRYRIGRIKEVNNPCESINLERMIMFIAIPKTGSASVRSYTRGRGGYLIPQEHLNFRESCDALLAHLIRTRLGKNRDFPSRDTPSYDEIYLSKEKLIRKMIKFSVVRNPWARTVSLYYRAEGIKLSDSMPFERFVDKLCFASDTCVYPSRHANQIDWLLDSTGKVAVDFVERLETLNSRINEINERLQGRCTIGDARLNVNPSSQSKSYRDIYSERSRKRVGLLFEKDIDLFGYSF